MNNHRNDNSYSFLNKTIAGPDGLVYFGLESGSGSNNKYRSHRAYRRSRKNTASRLVNRCKKMLFLV